MKNPNDKDYALLAQKKKLQMEAMLKQTDVKKIEHSLIEVELAMREIKHKQERLQQEFTAKENEYKKMTANHTQMQAELIKFKHQINTLGRE